MLHALFTLVAAVSLIVCMVVAFLSAASYRRSYHGFVYRHHYDTALQARAPQDHVTIAGGEFAFLHRDILEVDKSPSYETSRRLATQPTWRPEDPPWQWSWWSEPGVIDPARGTPRRFGFGTSRWPSSGTRASSSAGILEASRTVVLPGWFLFLVTASLPAVWLTAVRRRRLRARRRAAGLCLYCGYDLRASTGRCPECGQAVHSDFEPSESFKYRQ